MKKITFLMMLTIIIGLVGCAVSNDAGRIRITNYADIPAANVKVGIFTIAAYIPPGGSYDFWHFTPLVGKPTANGFEMPKSESIAGYSVDDLITFNVNYHSTINLYKDNSDDYTIGVINNQYEQGVDYFDN